MGAGLSAVLIVRSWSSWFRWIGESRTNHERPAWAWSCDQDVCDVKETARCYDFYFRSRVFLRFSVIDVSTRTVLYSWCVRRVCARRFAAGTTFASSHDFQIDTVFHSSLRLKCDSRRSWVFQRRDLVSPSSGGNRGNARKRDGIDDGVINRFVDCIIVHQPIGVGYMYQYE